MSPPSIIDPLDEEEAARLESTGKAGADARGDGVPISADELFHLLQNSRRRAVLRYLEGREGPVRMRDVAEQVAAWEHDTTVDRLSSDQRQRVYIALYQSHLETLADAGVIAYNKPRGVIEPQPLLDRVASYLGENSSTAVETDGADDGRWERRYLGVSAVGSVLLIGVAVDLPALQAVSGFAVSALLLLLFCVLTLAKHTPGDTTDSVERAGR